MADIKVGTSEFRTTAIDSYRQWDGNYIQTVTLTRLDVTDGSRKPARYLVRATSANPDSKVFAFTGTKKRAVALFKQLDRPDKDRAEPDTLTKMSERGGRWAAFRNIALDSANLGHLQFVAFGPGLTFEHPPERCPATSCGLGWKYRFEGEVDVATGLIKPYEGPRS